MTIGVLLILIAALLVTQVVLVRRSASQLRLIVWLQASFWLLAYVFRPLYLILARPVYPNPLDDARLDQVGYVTGLTPGLETVLFGQAVFISVLLLLKARWPSGESSPLGSAPPEAGEGPILWILFGLGWIGRLAYLANVGPAQLALSPFAAAAAPLLVVLSDGSRVGVRARLTLLTFSEVAWAYLFLSKTPALALLSAFILRGMMRMRRAEAIRRLPVIAAAVVVVFVVLQPLKGVHTAATVRSYQNTSHPEVAGTAVAILQRTDLIEAVTDAHYFPRRPWLSSSEYAKRALLGAVPKGPLAKQTQAGILWSRRVRAASYPGPPSSTPVATGPVAEGYVEGGLAGIAIEEALLAAVAVAAAHGLRSPRVAGKLFASVFVFGAVLYEQGALGLSEATAKALEIALAALVLKAVYLGHARLGGRRQTARVGSKRSGGVPDTRSRAVISASRAASGLD
ncbi:MAG TPA: hypothetical protein VHB18_00955 [Mycobacteriales bacterium]|nr:hypothetical protein [Mycobacteriales bacterium]